MTTQVYKIGDCLELMKEIPENSIDFVLTDPPYGINYISGRYKKDNPFNPIDNDNNFDLKFNNTWLEQCYFKSKFNSCLMLFTSYQVVDKWIQVISKYWKIINLIVWVKNNWTAGDLNGNLGNQYEFIIFGIKGNFKIKGYRYSNVWQFDREPPDGHPTVKPISLLKRAIEVTTDEDAIVLDPFLGSGTTLRACRETNRNGIGFEINSDYEPIIRKRLMVDVPSLETWL